jgi:glycopeptide antibiotics resistance protein
LALGIEILQIFVISRFAEFSDLLPAIGGIALGAGGASYFRSSASAISRTQDRGFIRLFSWYALAILYAGFLVLYFCWPLEIDQDPERIRTAWSQFFRPPMTALYHSTETNAAVQIVRKLCLWSVLGLLVSWPIFRTSLPPALRFVFLFAGWCFCVVVAAGIELFQLLLPMHTPDSTDIGLYSLGAAIGIFGTRWWHRQSTFTVKAPVGSRAKASIS